MAGNHGSDAAAEAWGLFFRFFFLNKPRMMALAQELDLAPMQVNALRLLEPGAEVTMRALADGLVCDPSNVTGIVDRLEARGLIERREAAHDRRVKLLALTATGQLVREQVAARMSEPPPALAALSRADQRALRDILRKAVAAAEAEQPKPERAPARRTTDLSVG